MFKKILIANRGEIALRVIRACREIGIKTVAVYSDIDRLARHVTWADEAYLIGPAPAKESYLCMDKILEVAKKSGAEAIHPGYGFLSENADFADACRKAGLQFIGPRGESMRKLGDKLLARRTAEKVGVPTVPGIKDPLSSAEEASKIAEKFGYPVLLKARAGGGGKGMRKVENRQGMESAFRLASSEAANSFNDPALYLEKYVEEPHHIEIQILGDRHGHVIALGERECSVQRRHQKVIEESPSPYIKASTRKKLLEAAVLLGKEAGYENAGTMEFLVDKNQDYYFLEMNARLQVEHPVTEQVTRLDLVRAQLQIAAGEKLEKILPKDYALQGHSIECRIYAEDPDADFMPSAGKLQMVRSPEGPGVRVDSAVFSGTTISVYYDPMIAKLITFGKDREETILRMERALEEYQIVGVKTNIAFLEAILSQSDFRKGHYHTGLIEQNRDELKRKSHEGFEEIASLAALIHQREKIKTPLISTGAGASLVSPWKLIGRKEGFR
ncbi:MAG: acetyl-CoA carboxylase biotin carboxylase subunit [Deltaproteobacteria bacterium]|nr:acetyl-CoA carboxylase biotin carboxylase subunit [Deltaproteobacteria bacterium]